MADWCSVPVLKFSLFMSVAIVVSRVDSGLSLVLTWTLRSPDVKNTCMGLREILQRPRHKARKRAGPLRRLAIAMCFQGYHNSD